MSNYRSFDNSEGSSAKEYPFLLRHLHNHTVLFAAYALLYLCFLIIGALAFQYLEWQPSRDLAEEVFEAKENFLKKYPDIQGKVYCCVEINNI